MISYHLWSSSHSFSQRAHHSLTIASLALFLLSRGLMVAADFRRFLLQTLATLATLGRRVWHLRTDVALVLHHPHVSVIKGLRWVLLLIALVDGDSTSLTGWHAVRSTVLEIRATASSRNFPRSVLLHVRLRCLIQIFDVVIGLVILKRAALIHIHQLGLKVFRFSLRCLSLFHIGVVGKLDSRGLRIVRVLLPIFRNEALLITVILRVGTTFFTVVVVSLVILILVWKIVGAVLLPMHLRGNFVLVLLLWQFGLDNSILRLEESRIELISEEPLLFLIQKHVPDGKNNHFRHLHNDEPLQPAAFLFQCTELTDAIAASCAHPDQGLQEGHEEDETPEHPLHDEVDGFKCQCRLRGIPKPLHLHVVTLTDVEFEERWIHEIGCQCEESQSECELEALGNVWAGGREARDMRSESHHGVERQQERVWH